MYSDIKLEQVTYDFIQRNRSLNCGETLFVGISALQVNFCETVLLLGLKRIKYLGLR